MLTIKNPSNFRHTILSSILAGQNIVIESINEKRNTPGLKAEQSKFLMLIQLISNGTKIMVSKGGRELKFYPGIIVNNEGVQIEFQCGNRSISYFLEYLILISIFGKQSLNIHLKGITNDDHDSSVDTIQHHLIPLLKEIYHFDNQLSMRILKRGYGTSINGEIQIIIPTIRKLGHINQIDKGYVKRVRGFCSGSNISKSILNKVGDQAKNILLNYLPDVWIFTDHYANKESHSQGYALTLKAETNTGAIITFDSCFQEGNTQEFTTSTVAKFMDEIQHSGYISTNYQWFIMTLMALSEKKTSSFKIGRVSPFTVNCLRIMNNFFGVTFEFEQSQSENLAIARCLGLGYENYARIMK